MLALPIFAVAARILEYEKQYTRWRMLKEPNNESE